MKTPQNTLGRTEILLGHVGASLERFANKQILVGVSDGSDKLFVFTLPASGRGYQGQTEHGMSECKPPSELQVGIGRF
jgi:hypothetical protein